VRLLKSILVGVIAAGASFLFLRLIETTKLPTVTTQRVVATKVAEPKFLTSAQWSEPITVNLPHGERFLYIADGKPFGYDGRLYVTRSVKIGGDIVTFWKPGGHPGTWEPFLYIQEH
jgi:hypothetical protein